jgi:ribosomal protein S26
MGGSRGREKLMTCESCHRQVPRGKAVEFEKRSVFSTDLRTADNIFTVSDRVVYYCISCAKHRKIFEKKKKMMQRQGERRYE